MSYVVGHAQANGRKYVTFSFSLADGSTVTTERGPFSDTTTQTLDAIEAVILAQIVAQKKDAEFRDRVSRVAALNLVFNNTADFAERLLDIYQGTKQEQRCYVCWWIIEMISAGFVTDTQVRNAFGLTANQWNTKKTDKVQPRHDAWATILIAEGE